MTDGTRQNDEAASGLRELLRSGLTRSLASLLIKIATAGLTYFMFVALSRTMSTLDYGLFAFGFSLATVLSIGASMGQQTAILRFWPEDTGRGDTEAARTDIRAGWALTLIAGSAIAAVLGLVGFGLGAASGDLSSTAHLMAAALLVLPMGAAEYASSALRAQGSVWTALAPRDVIWRLVLPLGVVACFAIGISFAGWAALLFAAVLLTAVLALQAVLAHWRGYDGAVSFAGLRAYWAARGRPSRWFLAGTLVDSAALNVDIVLIGLFVAAESAGLYFNAFRTAGLMTLFMFAITLVIAPMVARTYHAGDLRKAQAISTFCAWAGFLFSLGVFLLYVLFGDLILSLFGDTYSDGTLVLIVLSVGLLFDAATGPTRIVMNMTGHERQYVLIFGSIIGLGLVAQIVVIPYFGVLAAASVNAATRIIAQVAIAVWTRRHVGIDTSLFGIFRLFGAAPASAPARHS
jgi:O-antigen/teichoic acid export membrane protein